MGKLSLIVSELRLSKNKILLKQIIKEDANADKEAEEAESTALDAKINALQQKKQELSSEDNITEMARNAILYKLADGYENKLADLPWAHSTKRMKWVNGIIDYLKDVGAASVNTIAREKFNVPQQMINDYMNTLNRLGVIKPEKEGEVPQFQRMTFDEPSEPKKLTKYSPEDMLVGPHFEYGNEEN